MPTNVTIEPGVCGFTCNVVATLNDDDEVVVEVETGCKAVRGMIDELGDTFDPMEICFNKPGTGPFFEYASEHFPIHVACPTIGGIAKAIEVEGKLALPHNVSVTFN
ncbi:MAG: hypothetical protein IJF97_06110 [Eggerthellaceae bacterium]|nr:hypothetical protein [Eggerthellaceae bacterium]MBQ6390185.1 hypothetical protein [Eggerthellaceae bacterium]